MRVSGEKKSLTTAAPEVDVLSFAALAGLLHPRISAEFLKGFGGTPDLLKGCLLDIFKLEPWEYLRRMTGEYGSLGRNQ